MLYSAPQYFIARPSDVWISGNQFGSGSVSVDQWISVDQCESVWLSVDQCGSGGIRVNQACISVYQWNQCESV